VRRQSLGLIAAFGALAVGCGSSSSSSSSTAASSSSSSSTPSSTATSSAALSTRKLSGVGLVLVNGQGRTLYVFAPDSGKKVTCTGACAAVWPPLMVASGQKPSVSGGVNASLVSSDPNPSGGQVATYAGWPLYTYTADPGPGTDRGQGINSSGGRWHVIAPSGTVVTGKSSSGGGRYSGGGAYGGGGSTSGGTGY
jgi:predicted lipoprotein with Yx(FWY)xxD motif